MKRKSRECINRIPFCFTIRRHVSDKLAEEDRLTVRAWNVALWWLKMANKKACFSSALAKIKKACFSIRDPWGGKLARKVILKKACFSIFVKFLKKACFSIIVFYILNISFRYFWYPLDFLEHSNGF